MTSGPIGFSSAWLIFDPYGMSFDTYFDLNDTMKPIDQVTAMLVGLTPRATHLPYTDLSRVNSASGVAPSVGLACQMCAGIVAAEVAKIILGRGPIHSAPHYAQFDAYRRLLRTGRMPLGNRHPWQRLKHFMMRRRLSNCVNPVSPA